MYNRKLCNNLYVKFKQTKDLSITQRSVNSKSPDKVFLEKCVESPIIVIPQSMKVDLIGPPNSMSNLRPIVRQHQLQESNVEQKLRHIQNETQEWNEKFWKEHNMKFMKEKNAYIESRLKPDDDRKTLTPDEMSEFYKRFLDDNWKTHVRYNFEWYKKNFLILYYAARANLENLYKF